MMKSERKSFRSSAGSRTKRGRASPFPHYGTHAANPSPPHSTNHRQLFESLVRRFGEFLFEVDRDRKFLNVWTSHQLSEEKRRASFFNKRAQARVSRQIFEALKDVFESVVRAGGDEEIEFPLDLPSGLRWFKAHLYPVGPRCKPPRSVSLLARDVTQRKMAQDNLRRREALLAHAEQVTQTGCWEFNVKTGQRDWSLQLFKLYGLNPANGIPPAKAIYRMTEPADRKRVRRTIESAIFQSVPFETESRHILPDGRRRIFFTRGLPLLDETGKTSQLVGVVQDITDQKVAEAKLRKSERLLTQAEQMAGLGSWELNVADWTVSCSRECFRLFNLKPSSGSIPLETIWSMLHRKDLDQAKEALNGAILRNTPLEHVSRYVLTDGTIRVLRSRGVSIADAAGNVTRIIGFNQDITEQTRTEDNLRRLSGQLLTLRSEEQRRVARELHETASQTLTALKMTLRQIGNLLPNSDLKARELVESSRTLTMDAMREVRTVSSLLHPPILDEAGLIPGLRSYTKLFSERSGLEVNLVIREDFPRLPRVIDLTIFASFRKRCPTSTGTLGRARRKSALNTIQKT
jgi:PAS domain-containing protein